MRVYGRLAAGIAVVLMLLTGAVQGQGKPECDPQGRVKTRERVEGQVIKVDPAKGILTVRETDGTVHEFQASKETLQDQSAIPSRLNSGKHRSVLKNGVSVHKAKVWYPIAPG